MYVCVSSQVRNFENALGLKNLEIKFSLESLFLVNDLFNFFLKDSKNTFTQ